jgi:hypothetical protein
MNFIKSVLFLFALFAFLFTSVAWSADISGTWTFTMKNAQNRDESFDLVIKAAGENLTVTTSTHPALKNLVGSGTLKGDAVAISVKTIDEHNIEFVSTGKVAGNKMTGTRELKLGAPPAGRTIPPDAVSPTGTAGASASGQVGAKGTATDEISTAFTAIKK